MTRINDNYISWRFGGVQRFHFFASSDPSPRMPPPGGSVWRRPSHWPVSIPEIRGEFCTDDISTITIGGEAD